MKTFTFLAVAAAVFVHALPTAAAVQNSADAATDVSNPIYKNLGFPKDAEVVHIKVLGGDTILEEGPENEVESKPQGEEQAMSDQAPVTHTLDSVNLPDSEVEAPAVKLADVKDEPRPKASSQSLGVSSKGYHAKCPSNCSLTRHRCPYGCKAKHCIIRYKYPFQKKYIVRVKKIIKYRRRVLVKVKYCKHVRYYTHYGYRTKCVYFYKPHYKWVVYYKTKYFYVTKYKTVYKYKYKTGLTCKSSYY